MHAPQSTVQSLTEPTGTSCPASSLVWGVLVSNTAPTKENGLLTYAQARYAGVCSTQSSVIDSVDAGVLSAPGDAWLWNHLPSAQRSRHFPVGSSGDAAHTHRAEVQTVNEWCSTLHLLLPLCSRSGQGQVTVGRLTSNDVVLATNPCVSCVHCSLSYQQGSTREVDSLHGTDAETQRAADEAAVAVARAVAQHNGYAMEDDLLQEKFREDALQNEDEQHQVQQDGDVNNKGANGEGLASSSPPPLPARDVAAVGERVNILLSDYSTNGCMVEGRHVGKGKSARLRSGDTVELINAGPRHTADYNLSFTFLTADGFLAWVLLQQVNHPPHAQHAEGHQTTHDADAPLSRSDDTAAAAHRREQRQRQTVARRHALLCKAQWNVEAQVRRMYGHRVEEFYTLDRAKPLGQGTFGVVYRAALRNDLGEDSASGRAPQAPSLSTVAAAILSKVNIIDHGSNGTSQTHGWEQQLFSTAAACVWTKNATEEAELGAAYVREKERRSPTAVLRAAAGSAVQYVFAVKIIRKQRMLLNVLQQQEANSDDAHEKSGTPLHGRDDTPIPVATTATTISTTMTAGEAAVVQQLVLLETQPDDLAAQRREEWTAGALASLQLADAAAGSGSFIGKSHDDSTSPVFSLGSQEADAEAQHGKGRKHSERVSTESNAGVLWKQRGVNAQQREQRRHELLRCLPEPLRRSYEKELQHRRRQQCEINILLAVRHPNVTALFEVFDQPDQLALVMEQATGGEVWDLLQPYRRRKRSRWATRKQPRADDPSSVARDAACDATAEDSQAEASEGEGAPAYDDIDLIGIGGPLPEYLVKLIIVQVLEAVLYLHTMGIIHRDLKLENLMLLRPCDRYALNALQLQLLLQQLRDYEHSTLRGTQCPVTPASPSSNAAVAEVEFCNPLSVLHTVHIPRALWPVVKVTDFGLSRVLDQLQTRPSSTAETLHGFAAAEHGAEVPERVRLVYARNDATTSCGTPIYAAPEVTHPTLRPNKVGYSAAVDMYSVGVIAYALLTGRAPFPSKRHPRRPDGPPVVDYDAPLRFQRRRRRPATQERNRSDPPTPPQQQQQQQPACADEPSACLPPLAVVESVRVPLLPELPSNFVATTAAATTAATTGKESSAMAATAHTQLWRVHAEALAARVRRAQDGRADDDRSNKRRLHSNKRETISLFTTTVHQLSCSLASYAEGCAFHRAEVDLDRLVYVSTEAATAANDGAAAASASNGRTVDAAGCVADVALPPISALGASFLRGLLEKYPSQRLTAYEALRHPWLRECVAAAEVAAPAHNSVSSVVP
ncbi:serine-threonine protein kinase-like protein [Leptomonas pyrrhocoris]|uniref:Serine-threonine protein kinase-like protein n=1 Tax=Leptomonas pyrrhocoris TaxID=157538 RepID=A0A0M9FTB2_LEPPY|nr:serine-threonine protein kinase-like protein [Leptomonas pyrrhocoris]KPA75547.1 serine-threonine protein kinase-like protein [Leptomonas pyrrhocoris]|eukprot:XP_015653986.1 serine-threonine protein kinase-like protein [Leptomonas pyrrhocoris]